MWAEVMALYEKQKQHVDHYLFATLLHATMQALAKYGDQIPLTMDNVEKIFDDFRASKPQCSSALQDITGKPQRQIELLSVYKLFLPHYRIQNRWDKYMTYLFKYFSDQSKHVDPMLFQYIVGIMSGSTPASETASPELNEVIKELCVIDHQGAIGLLQSFINEKNFSGIDVMLTR